MGHAGDRRGHRAVPYITLGGLSAAIYNEVLQFFVIIAALLPLTLIGLYSVGGWSGSKEKSLIRSHFSLAGYEISGFDHPIVSAIGLVFGLGFVLSFGYWTTNFVEVQRSMAADSLSSARKTRSLARSRRCSCRSSSLIRA